jgi:SPP1 gp7 family putative phage head morphogenesis protein
MNADRIHRLASSAILIIIYAALVKARWVPLEGEESTALLFFAMNISLNGHKKKPDPLAVLDDGDKIARLMRPFYAQLSKLAFDDANAIDGIDISFSLDNPYVQKVIDRLAKNVRGVTDTTKDDIRRLTAQAADQGWGTEQLAREIRKAGADLSRSRSLAISRTESASGYTGGSLAAYQASGVVDETEWLMGGDSCDICQGLNGQRAALGESFPGGYDGPPAHPNCTCVLSPIVRS